MNYKSRNNSKTMPNRLSRKGDRTIVFLFNQKLRKKLKKARQEAAQ